MLRTSVIGAFALAACLSVQMASPMPTAEIARRKYEQKIKDPTGTAVPNGKDGYMQYYPTETDYIKKRLGPTAAIGIGLAAFSLLAFLTCCLCRCCAWCCDCAKSCCCNFFCGTEDPDEKGYTKCRRLVLIILFSVATAGVCVMCIVGDMGVKEVCGGTSMLIGDTLGSVTKMSTVMNTMGAAITALGQDGAQIAAMKEPIDSIIKSITDIKKQVDVQCKGNGNAEMGSKIYFAIFGANLLWGFIAYFSGCANCPMTTLTISGFILMILAWILMSVYLGVGAALDDTCVQLQLWATCKGVAPAGGYPATCIDGTMKLDKFLKCPDVKEFAKNYNTTYNQMTTIITGYKAAYTNNVVQFRAPATAFPPLLHSQLADFKANSGYRTSVYEILKVQVPGCDPTKVPTPDSQCMIGALPKQCPQASSIVPATNSACAQKSVIVASDLMWGNSYIASCNYLKLTAEKAVADGGSCSKLGDGFIYLTVSHGLIATCYIAIIMITCWARKVWDSDYDEITRAEALEMERDLDADPLTEAERSEEIQKHNREILEGAFSKEDSNQSIELTDTLIPPKT